MSAPVSKLAWRNLWRNHRRTVIMLLAISVGVWAMIFMTALMRGMVDDMVNDGIQSLPGHVQIHHPAYLDDPSIDNRMNEPGAAFRKALGDDSIVAWTSRLKLPAMISSERDSRGITLLGVNPAGEIGLGFDPESIVEGRFLSAADDNGLVVGQRLLEKLETTIGKRVVLMTQDPDNQVADRGFRIVGVYSATLAAREEQFVYAGKNTVQDMLGTPGSISEVAVNGIDYRQSEALAVALRPHAGEALQTLPWQEIDPYLGAMLPMMDGFVFIWILVVFIALSFGLMNTLMMAVFERIREFGLMQALGMKPNTIRRLVLTESLCLLVMGLAAGNLLAWGTLVPLKGGIDISAVAQGMEAFGAASVLYPAVKARDVLTANLVVLVLGILTSSLPAWKASNYKPVEALTKI